MISKRYTNIIACPECKGKIGEIEISNELLGFFCEICELIFPLKEEIIILLPKSIRNYTLEYDLIQNIKNKLLNCTIERLKNVHTYTNNTLNLLDSAREIKGWEWEDEKFWSNEYKNEAEALVQKNWNDRIWQREFLVKHLVNQTSLNGKTILDVGCGEGQNFRFLMCKYCDNTTLYIATDISLTGLQLNRLRNKHTNSLYILCSAHRLPFHREMVDILCYFGILHHTERKSGTIPHDSVFVKKCGYILIHEALARKSSLPSFLKPKIEESTHEERLNKNELLTKISNIKDLKIIASREIHSIFFTGMMRFFKNSMIHNKAFFCFISNLDILFIKLFGSIIPFFKPSGIMLLVRKSQE